MFSSRIVGLLVIASGFGLIAPISSTVRAAEDRYPGRIKPYESYPRYWQYKGKPVLLLGGTNDDNLFQMPDVVRHLDQLVRAGGNYVRNTMSSRKEMGFEVQPFKQLPNGKYDLNAWNDEYWKRFESLLNLTRDRDIIVQIEVWAFHDFFGKWWEENPWNPKNNVNYTISNTMLQVSYVNPMRQMHAFFFSVPNLNNDVLVSRYQRKFMDKILSYTVRYQHVLYCMTNEIHPLYSPEWGWYWSAYIKGTCDMVGNPAETTEMFWTPDMKAGQHRACLDFPDVYSFFEASQNSSNKSGQDNWDDLQFVYNYLAKNPRPINHVKIYGTEIKPYGNALDRDALARFWRNIIGGSASSRFHRPPSGIGLNEDAQAHIKSMGLLMKELDIFRCTPDSASRLLSNREVNEAYLTFIEGEQYAVYFPDGGSVDLSLSGAEGTFTMKWLDIEHSKWQDPKSLEVDKSVTLKTPGSGHWVALLTKKKGGKTAPPDAPPQAE
jgi:hypothetical protein